MDFQVLFQLPDVPNNRNKVDFQLTETVDSQQMESDSLKSEPVYDLRKSLAWDSAFLNSPGVLDPEELFETLNVQAADNGVDITGHREPISLPHESVESARISSLRKSLAWNSAFFTSAGVLDAEELSVINRGYKGPELAMLPLVEEEIWMSTESKSSMNTDGYSLASLDIDLFYDIRASIRKSSDALSNGASSARKQKRENGHVSRMLAASSQVRHAASSGGSNPLSSRKPPKISSRANPSPTLPSKRASMSAGLIKMDNKATKSVDGKNMAMSKKMRLRESCSSIPSSMPSVKSPSSVLPAGKDEFMRFCNASADFIGKSPPNLLRRTTDFCLAASGSRFRTPLKSSVGNKNESLNSRDSPYLPSTTKSSIYTSPSSSIDGWSSESSSSSSIQQRSNSSATSPINTPFREIFDRDTFKASASERHHYDRPHLGNEIWKTKIMNPQKNDIFMCSSPAPANVSRKLRPSGLRMPSPKIGYFDAENATGLAQSGALKFHSGGQGTSSKIGNGISKPASSKIGNGISKPTSSTNRTRHSKHWSGGISTGPVSKSGKDDGKICSREKRQPLKQQRVVKAHGLGECNKENIVSFENQVDDLSQRMGAIGFSRDVSAGSIGN